MEETGKVLSYQGLLVYETAGPRRIQEGCKRCGDAE